MSRWILEGSACSLGVRSSPALAFPLLISGNLHQIYEQLLNTM